MFQNLKAKIHKAKENGLTTLLRYVTCPKSMNYEIILTIIVSNSLKFELVQFFLDQTLCTIFLILKEGPFTTNNFLIHRFVLIQTRPFMHNLKLHV